VQSIVRTTRLRMLAIATCENESLPCHAEKRAP